MPEPETWTNLRLLEWTTGYLSNQGSDSPRLDAELLLSHALGCARIELYTSFDQVPDETTRTAFRGLVKRRAEGAPVAYLLEQREFFSLPFHVSPAVLIPRPETELLVVSLLDLVKQQEALRQEVLVADVGTGSGVIAVCVARHLSQARVVATDISREALEVARRNVQRHAVEDRVRLVKADLLEGVESSSSAAFDFVISNPPYVSSQEMSQLARDVAEHEPSVALEAGPTGTEVIRRLIPQAAALLKPGGWLLIEISPMIAEAVERLFAEEARFEPPKLLPDLAGHVRVVQARRRP